MAKIAPSRASGTPVNTGEIRDCAETGTALATIAYAPSCSLDPADRGPRATWGGARNRADRASYYLAHDKVLDMIAAALFAERIGLPFNRHWTVHYQMAGIAERDGAAFIGRLLSLVRKWVRRMGGQMAAMWARENGHGKGGHVHILLHLPHGMTLHNRTRRWIKVAGGKPVRRVSRVRTIGGLLTNVDPGSAHYRSNADAVLAYLVKGASDQTGHDLALARFGEGGRIIGKRCGWTENIGQKARLERT